MDDSPFPEAAELVGWLRAKSQRLVLAESCTCGMTAAILGGVPGASEVFCGSAVTYRESVKTEWLGVETDTLRQFTAVSRQTTDELALRLLQRTGDADWSAAITGHLGPGAPPESDGHVFLSLAHHVGPSPEHQTVASPEPRIVARHELELAAVTRSARQLEAAQTMIRWILMRTKTFSVALHP